MTNHERKLESPENIGLCWSQGPKEPFGVRFFYTIRGSEYLHLYLWVIKDLSWTQDWLYSGYIFGILAIIWSFFLIIRSLYYRNFYETIVSVAQLLWLVANFWWMTGEVHDYYFPNDYPQYEDRQRQASYIMMSALCWLGVYYFIIRPLGLLKPNADAVAIYDDTGLSTRFPLFFNTWREYENIHILFWLGKDTAWSANVQSMWVIFVIPTLTIAFDFVLVTSMMKPLFIDHVHYFAQLLWVLANIVWAFGELFYPEDDEPYQLGSTSSAAHVSFRWNSSWLLVGACLAVGCLYCVWIPLTLSGKISKHRGRADRRNQYRQYASVDNSEGCVDPKSMEVFEENINILHMNSGTSGSSATSNSHALREVELTPQNHIPVMET